MKTRQNYSAGRPSKPYVRITINSGKLPRDSFRPSTPTMYDFAILRFVPTVSTLKRCISLVSFTARWRCHAGRDHLRSGDSRLSRSLTNRPLLRSRLRRAQRRLLSVCEQSGWRAQAVLLTPLRGVECLLRECTSTERVRRPRREGGLRLCGES